MVAATVSQPPVVESQASGPVPTSRVPVEDVQVVAQRRADLGNGDVTTVQLGAGVGVNPLPSGRYLLLLYPATAPATEQVPPGEYGTGIEDSFLVNGSSALQRCPSVSHSESKPALLPGGSGDLSKLQQMLTEAIRTHGAQPRPTPSVSTS